MQTSFYTSAELKDMGFKMVGANVQISRKASFYGAENMTLGSNVRIDDFCIFSGAIHVGSYVHIAAYTALYGRFDTITIGDLVGISSRVAIYTFSDDCIWGTSLTNPTVPDEFKVMLDKGPVAIEKHALVSSGCVILPSTEIKTGAVIGALSLVRGRVDPWGIYKGNPATFCQKRPSKRILALEEELRRKYPW